MKSLTSRQLEYLEKVPEIKKNTVRKALTGQSRAAAMKAKCLDCVGFEDSTARIKTCTVEICALWPYRPFQSDTETEEESTDSMQNL